MAILGGRVDPDSLEALELYPGTPEWLERGEHPEAGRLMSLHLKAKRGDERAAFEIATAYERGDLPGGPSIQQAMRWLEFAANLDSAPAAVRLAHLVRLENGPAARQVATRLVGRAIAIACDRPDVGVEVGVAAVQLLMELEPDDEAVAAAIAAIGSERFARHPDAAALEQRLRQHRSTPLSLRVVDGKIEDDGDFKAGIYKRLERPLPLVPVSFDPEFVRAQLDMEFPWFASANAEIYKQLVVAGHSETPAFRLRPLLLAGPPGCGKTSWSTRLAELAGVPVRTVMAGGGADAMFLRGTPRGWASARPGAVLQAMAVEQVGNPLFVVDEIEKASESTRNGRIWDVLLQLLEPASAKAYLDECLQQPCDLSWVSWVATCNALSPLPRPLLERFTVILIEQPGAEHFPALVAGVVRQFAAELGVDERMLPAFDGQDLDLLRTCKSPREINRVGRAMIEDRLVADRKTRLRM